MKGRRRRPVFLTDPCAYNGAVHSPPATRAPSRSPRSWLLAASLLASAAILGAAAPLEAGQIEIPRPGEHEFVLDLAGLLKPADAEKIRTDCAKLLKEKATPIVVVTIESMAAHGGEGLRIETFATLLFDQWGVGHAELGGRSWNTGILLLVSKGDRKARIELGAGWGRRQDAQCRQIMAQRIVPAFKRGQDARGIVQGVEALDAMARGLSLPRAPRPWWHWALVVLGVVLAVWTGISLYRSGHRGWAWIFWAVVLAAGAFLLFRLLTRRGGGFSGGSFGGGFSGGGGASGSW